MFLARQSQKQFSGKLQQQDAQDEAEAELKNVQLLINNLDFDRAKMLTHQICQTHPTDPRPWQQLFELHKSQPRQKAFHQVTFDLCKQFVAQDAHFAQWQNTVDQVLNEYRELAPKTPALNGNMCLAFARTYWRNGKHDLAQSYLSLARERGGNAGTMAALLKDMIPYYQRRQQTEQAAKLTAILKTLQPPVKASAQAD